MHTAPGSLSSQGLDKRGHSTSTILIYTAAETLPRRDVSPTRFPPPRSRAGGRDLTSPLELWRTLGLRRSLENRPGKSHL